MVILNISEVSLYSPISAAPERRQPIFFLTDGSGTIVSARDKQPHWFHLCLYPGVNWTPWRRRRPSPSRIDGGQIRLYERIPGTDWYLVEEMSASAAFGTLNLVRNGASGHRPVRRPDSGGASLRLPADSPPHHPAPGQPGPGHGGPPGRAHRRTPKGRIRPYSGGLQRYGGADLHPSGVGQTGRSGRSIWRSWIFSRPRSTPTSSTIPSAPSASCWRWTRYRRRGRWCSTSPSCCARPSPRSVEFIPLGEELDTLKCYVELQHLRYPDTFDYSCEVDEALRDNTLPKLLLQPVVENSIFHGVGRHKIHIRLRGWLEGGHPDPPGGGRWSGHFQRQDRPGDEQGLAD